MVRREAIGEITRNEYGGLEIRRDSKASGESKEN